MIKLLAAEGGYQSFTLRGGEFAWLFFSVATALLALGVGFSLVRGVLADIPSLVREARVGGERSQPAPEQKGSRSHDELRLALHEFQRLRAHPSVRGLEISGWVDAGRDALVRHGADLSAPLALVPAMTVMSNVVGNVPAVMLVLPFVQPTPATRN